LGPVIGWRAIFYLTGSLGLVVAVAVFFVVKEPPRGQSEPELAGLEEIGVYRFDKRLAFDLFRKRSLLFLFAQGFFGTFPWNIITFWFFAYLETERGYDETAILLTMAPAVLILAGGYFVGGSLGDAWFKRQPRGRLMVSLTGITLGVIGLTLTMNVPVENRTLFFILLAATALFLPFSSANVIATVHDITLPEIRSTALSVQYFIENGSAALAPLLAGIIADRSSLGTAILNLSVGAWVIGAVLVAFAAYLVPTDIAALRQQLQQRALENKAA
jgi:predicted MFS family arabinose efflux permease